MWFTMSTCDHMIENFGGGLHKRASIGGFVSRTESLTANKHSAAGRRGGLSSRRRMHWPAIGVFAIWTKRTLLALYLLDCQRLPLFLIFIRRAATC